MITKVITKVITPRAPSRAQVITTRSYDDRLQTIANVRKAGISVCCGGILGLGETETDRIGLLHELSTMVEHQLVGHGATPL